MKFGQLKILANQELVVSRRYEKWMERNTNPNFSDEAVQFFNEQMRSVPRKREGTISASSLGKCLRQQQFVYLGMKQEAISARTSAIFANGTFMHLRWQMVGLTEGFLAEAEVPVPVNDLRLRGTMDGVLDDGSVLELKSANDHSFSRVMTYGPLQDHLYQGAAYLLATGRERVVYVYENKNTQDYTEIVKKRSELPMEEARTTVERFWELEEKGQLEEPLDAVYEGKTPCTWCPFFSVCLTTTWEEANARRRR